MMVRRGRADTNPSSDSGVCRSRRIPGTFPNKRCTRAGRAGSAVAVPTQQTLCPIGNDEAPAGGKVNSGGVGRRGAIRSRSGWVVERENGFGRFRTVLSRVCFAASDGAGSAGCCRSASRGVKNGEGRSGGNTGRFADCDATWVTGTTGWPTVADSDGSGPFARALRSRCRPHPDKSRKDAPTTGRTERIAQYSEASQPPKPISLDSQGMLRNSDFRRRIFYVVLERSETHCGGGRASRNAKHCRGGEPFLLLPGILGRRRRTAASGAGTRQSDQERLSPVPAPAESSRREPESSPNKPSGSTTEAGQVGGSF